MRHYAFPFLLSFTQVQEQGRSFGQAYPGYVEEAVHKGQGEDLAIINYTSGTTGVPKGVMLTHRNLIATAASYLQVDSLNERDEIMAYLPMAWIGDTFFSVVLSFLTGATVNCPEDTTTVRQDFREIGPTMTFAPPRIWENLLSQAQVKIGDAGWLQRTLCQRLSQPWYASRQAASGGEAMLAEAAAPDAAGGSGWSMRRCGTSLGWGASEPPQQVGQPSDRR